MITVPIGLVICVITIYCLQRFHCQKIKNDMEIQQLQQEIQFLKKRKEHYDYHRDVLLKNFVLPNSPANDWN